MMEAAYTWSCQAKQRVQRQRKCMVSVAQQQDNFQGMMRTLASVIFCSCVIVSMKEGRSLLRTFAPTLGQPTTTDTISSRTLLSNPYGNFSFVMFLFASRKELEHLVPWTDSFAPFPLVQQRWSILPGLTSVRAILLRFVTARDPRGAGSRHLSHPSSPTTTCLLSIVGVGHAFQPSFPPFAARHPHHRPPATPAVSPAATKAR
mmetsp:Transcript_1391/g.8580  ORF Transcript_1391/g.8580 Transcript_1391/m.8580 type:complete len:204 (+) Transcript_1391:1081-1692(+)